ncbi:MAG TPA: AMP-binding protein, partial [Pirellulales bacterium]
MAPQVTASEQTGQLDTVMHEARLFPPPPEFAAKARIKSLAEYEKLWNEAAGDIEKFWGHLAKELHWFQPYTKVLEWNEPFAQWFVGGKTNASYNCLDIHLNSATRNKAAIIWEGEPGEQRTLTYQELHHEVCKFANALKKLGLKTGDVASIYMPMTPELAIAMLACARIGVVHSVIFGGFSSEAIADRNNNAKAKLVITADAGWRRGQQLPLKANVDAALAKSPTVKHCIVLRRVGIPIDMQSGRDHWWHELVSAASADCPATPLDSEAPLYIL